MATVFKINPKLNDIDNLFNLLVHYKFLKAYHRDSFEIQTPPIVMYHPYGLISSRVVRTKVLVSFVENQQKQYKEIIYHRVLPLGRLNYLDPIEVPNNVTKEMLTNILSNYLVTDEVTIDDKLVKQANESNKLYIQAKPNSYIYYGTSIVDIVSGTEEIQLNGFSKVDRNTNNGSIKILNYRVW